jgi:hypothetical protein
MCLVNFPASFCTTLIAESSAGDFANNSSNQNTASAEKHIKNKGLIRLCILSMGLLPRKSCLGGKLPG